MAPEFDAAAGMDSTFERALQALLDAEPLPPPSAAAAAAGEDPSSDPLRVVDAIARAHRAAMFGHDHAPEASSGMRWGHLELRAEIGRGASGTVYRAWDTRLAREVALKLLTGEADPDEALEEGRLLARLNHPNIVHVFDADTHDGTAGIWMEMLDGDTLDDVLARDGVFSAEETLLIGLDLTRALSAVHVAGLLHRDIKARNILRERGGRIVLMDLGAGRVTDQTPDRCDVTGTPMYMAPEVLAGAPATERSDIYCLGVVLYRLLTATYPVTGKDLRELRAAHATGNRTTLARARPDLPIELAAAIERACHPDPERRSASAADFETALAAALQRTLATRAVVASPAARAWARWRRAVKLGVASLAVVVVTIWGAWETATGRDARRAAGLAVPPRSPLYVTLNGGLAIVRGGVSEFIPYNPGTAVPLAVSSDLGVRTMSGVPPWMRRGAYMLDGTPLPPPVAGGDYLCCFYDGTTDGEFNYAARYDNTLLEPIGSRALAPAALYRFDRDWSNPEPLFPLAPDGVYGGVAYSGVTGSFFLARRVRENMAIEEWSRDGSYVGTQVNISNAFLAGLAVDPQDGTLWAVRAQGVVASFRLENYDTSGRFLGSHELEWPAVALGAAGAEFAWVGEVK
ncbi:MAG: protein kinase domain-containing protein [Acidobacteriota bacterium]